MSEKPVVYYFNGRGKMESIRWLLTVAEVEVSEGGVSFWRTAGFCANLIWNTFFAVRWSASDNSGAVWKTPWWWDGCMQGMEEIGLFWVNIKLKVQTRKVKSFGFFFLNLLNRLKLNSWLWVEFLWFASKSCFNFPSHPPHGLRATLCNLDWDSSLYANIS